MHIPSSRIGKINLGKMKLNELGRQKLDRSPVSRHSMQSYIWTCYRLRRRKGFKSTFVWTALDCHQGAPFISASAVPHLGGQI